ncbi:hypothetical protein ACM66B_005768 [Microbotryomycetes sp. NB124-2]
MSRTRSRQARRSASPETPQEPNQTNTTSSALPLDFHQRVYDLVRQVPEGRVTSYGTIARLMGYPKHSRHVGQALKLLPREMSLPHLPQRRTGQGADEQHRVETRRRRTGRHRGNSPTDDQSSEDDSANGDDNDDEDQEQRQPGQERDDVLPEPEPNPDWVPWHRVVSSSGIISPRGSVAAVRRQADWLRAEGVDVQDGPRADGAGRADNREGPGVDPFGLAGVEGGRVSMARFAWTG